ncbi:MAG: LEA type 2 family protein [Crocinitomicaceae bacterium]|nr:LEA type 2 family protein [Crocinitomicaceae bacterium]
MRNLLFFIAISFLITSCASFQVPEFRGGEKVSLKKVDGQSIKFSAAGKIYNGNWFGIKIKPSTLDLYVEDEYIGKVSLDKKVKLKRKKETELNADFTAKLESGAMFRALKFATKENIKIRLKGKVKAGVFIFSKKIDIDESKTISGSIFRMGGI